MTGGGGSGCGRGYPPGLDFALLLQHCDSAFLVLSRHNDAVLYASPNAARVLAGAPAVRVGAALLDGLHADDVEHARAMLRAVQAAPPDALPAFAHVRLRAAAARVLWCECKLSSDGVFAYCVLRDVSDEKRVEAALQGFLRATSHDVRTPVHGLQMAAALLAEVGALRADAAAAQLLAALRSCCRIMLAVVDNVLELQALEGGTPGVAAGDDDNNPSSAAGSPAAAAQLETRARERVPIDLAAVMAEVLDGLRCAGAGAATWPGAAAAQRALPPVLEGPPDLVRRVLKNMLLAAAHFAGGADATNGGALVAELALDDDVVASSPPPAGAVDVRVAVTAAGRPLSPTDAGDAFAACAPGGVGLALCVARSFARAMHGDLRVVASPEGARVEATMRLHLPGALQSPRTRTAVAAASAESAAAASAAAAALRPLSLHAPPPPPPEALTQRLFEHLMRRSDDFFSSGLVTDCGVAFDYGSAATHTFFGCLPHNITRLNIGTFMHPEDEQVAASAFRAAAAASAAAGGAPVPLAYTHRLRVHAGGFCPVHTAGCVAGSRWHTVCRKLDAQQARDATARGLLLAVGAALRAPADGARAAVAALAALPAVAADAEASFLADAVAASAALLLCTLRNVQLLPAVEAGRLPCVPTRFSPVQAVEELLRACRLACCAAAPRLAWASPAGRDALPAVVRADRGLFDQALLNLLTNAVRFDDGTGVSVAATCEPLPEAAAGATPHTHTLAVTVSDHGRGFSAAAAAHAFEPLEAAACAAGGGVGLGLYVARAAARAAGGDVTLAAAAPGAGASLTLCVPVAVVLSSDDDDVADAAPSLPLPASAAPAVSAALDAAAPSVCDGAPAPPPPPPRLMAAPAAPEPPALPRLRCHVADDHALNLTLVSRLLERKADFLVETSADGREAFDKITAAAAAGHAPHLVLLDMAMPHWSGPDAAKALRAWEAAAGPHRMRMPLFALTANVMDEHRAECEAAGMDGFLTKPLRVAALPELQLRAREYERAVVAAAAAAQTSGGDVL